MNSITETNKIPQRAGGLAVAKKLAPTAPCPRCGKMYPFQTSWMTWLGHLGLHGLADNHFDGDIKAAQRHLRNNGLARQDPVPWNNAWPKYRPVTGDQL
jgi:hypothetical protein